MAADTAVKACAVALCRSSSVQPVLLPGYALLLIAPPSSYVVGVQQRATSIAHIQYF